MTKIQSHRTRAAEAAVAFAAERPWEWMGDNELFGVRHPETEVTGYCSIMGKRGEFRALGLYPGGEGLKSFRLLAKEEEGEDATEKRIFSQNCLMVMFKKREESSEVLLQNFLNEGLQPIHEDCWPEFWSFQPGLVPMPAGEEELEFLACALEQALEVSLRKKANPELLRREEGKDETFLVRNLSEAREWQDQWEGPDKTFNFSPDRLSIPKAAAEKLKNGLAIRESFVLIDLFFLDRPQVDETEEGARHFFPKIMVLMNLQTQELYNITALHPHRLIGEMPAALVQSFGEMDFLPENVVVCDQEVFVLLRDMIKSLGMQIFLEPSANVREELKQELNL